MDESPDAGTKQRRGFVEVALFRQRPHGRLSTVRRQPLEEGVAGAGVVAPSAQPVGSHLLDGEVAVVPGAAHHVEILFHLREGSEPVVAQGFRLVEGQGHSEALGVLDEGGNPEAAREAEVGNLGALSLGLDVLVPLCSAAGRFCVGDVEHLGGEPQVNVLSGVDNLDQSRVAEELQTNLTQGRQLQAAVVDGGEHLPGSWNEALPEAALSGRVLKVGL